ncbi:putative glutathione-specific gamma-glutamylcyclotransferase 2 [Lucilia cuprina]|uniref:putative glutathione-specific gamma-glutamylcyclotransferase 2 n=1 Tax=Lucilia cuprina TaxID=7375 RepID=UPI001F053C55|nr:putative glutathione-specific gamma-glutamylcyclotransferase 2 [Lucilia cuprina]
MSYESEINDIYNEKFKKLVEITDSQKVDITKDHKEIDALSHPPNNPDDIWIFGYGSLIWKVDFPCIDWQRGYICGYLRRFYQHSIDHRGVKVKPGRVVTLIPAKPEDRVYGVAYRVAAKDKDVVIKHLDFREKNGYQRCTVPFHVFPEDPNKSCIDIVIYIATPENESWAGSDDDSKIDKIAEQIFTSAGPSGRNRDYLFNLALAMNSLFPGVHDQHLVELEAAVKARIESDEVRLLEKALKTELAYCKQHVVQETSKEANDCDIKNNSNFCQAKVDHLVRFCMKIGWREYFLTKELYGIHSLNLWGDEDRRQS